MPALRYRTPMQNSLPEKTVASTAIATDKLVERIAASGFIQEATSASTLIVGISRQSKSASDATNDPIATDHLHRHDLVALKTSTTPTQAMVGDLFNLTNSDTVNLGGAGTQVRLVELIGGSTTTAVFTVQITEQ